VTGRQPEPDSGEEGDYLVWRAAVQSHTPGRVDEALTRVSHWSLEDLESAIRILPRSP